MRKLIVAGMVAISLTAAACTTDTNPSESPKPTTITSTKPSVTPTPTASVEPSATANPSVTPTPTPTPKVTVQQVVIPFKTTNVNDATLNKGVTKVKTAGVNGLKEVTFTDGKPTSERVLKQPVDAVILVGTKPVATTKPTTKPTTAKPTKKPTATKPTTKPTKKPTATKPTTKPTTQKPTTKPTTAKPTTKPTTAKPTTKPTTAKPTTKPTTAKPTQKPITKPYAVLNKCVVTDKSTTVYGKVFDPDNVGYTVVMTAGGETDIYSGEVGTQSWSFQMSNPKTPGGCSISVR